MDEYSILRKKRKKNGFAATSLLISIAIALLVLVGAVLILGKVDNGINKVNDDSNMTLGSGVDMTCAGLTKEMVFNTNIRYMKEAAISYFTTERLPKNRGDVVKMTLKEMKDKHLILNVIDSTYKLCADNDSYVEIMKATNEYILKIVLSCNDMEDYLIVHLGCYDYCDRDVCEKQEPEKEYEYEYKKTTACTMNPWSNWGPWKLTREKTSNLKKEDTKVEIVNKDTVYTYDAVQDPVTYNCDKYPGYTRVNDKCVNTITVEATKTEDTYSCDTNAGYNLVDNKCVKKYKDEKDATKNEATYSCPSGYTRSVINYTVKSGDTLASVAKANNISNSALKLANKLTSDTLKVGQKLTIPVEYQNKCYKNVKKTDYKAAKLKEVSSTCYDEICSTELVPSCDNGYCEMETIRTCVKTPRICTKKTYSCSSYGSNYSLTSDNRCKATITTKEYTSATKNADTYNCDKYPGYTKSGAKCYKNVTDEKQPTVKTGEYVCNTQDGYELSGTKCVKKITKDADKNKVTYSCSANGYTLTKDNKCTKIVPANSKVTYYRYATRTCTGGSVSIKWSTSNNDSILISEGYKPTGVKRALTVTEK